MRKTVLIFLVVVGAPLVEAQLVDTQLADAQLVDTQRGDAQSSGAPISPDAGVPGQFDAGDRIHWFTRHSFGLGSQFTSLAVAGIATGHNTPEEHGPHWEGFGKRYGLAVSHHVISGGLEAGFGSLWGEDPRYFRVPER